MHIEVLHFLQHGGIIAMKRLQRPRTLKYNWFDEHFLYCVQDSLYYLHSKGRDRILPSSSIWVLDNRSSFLWTVYSDYTQGISYNVLLKGEGQHFSSNFPFPWSYRNIGCIHASASIGNRVTVVLHHFRCHFIWSCWKIDHLRTLLRQALIPGYRTVTFWASRVAAKPDLTF